MSWIASDLEILKLMIGDIVKTHGKTSHLILVENVAAG